MGQKFKLKNKLQENVFFAALLLNAAVFPFSEALISISAGLLLLQALLLRSWNHPSVKLRSRKILFFPMSVFLVYILGTFFTKDFSLAIYELNKMIFWLAIPLAVFLSPGLPPKKIHSVFIVFISAVLVSSIVVTGRLVLYDSLHLSEFRKFSIISHIRYSIQVGFAVILLTWFLFQKKSRPKISASWLIALITWLVLFLLLLKSLVGVLAFLGTGVIFLIYYALAIENRKIKMPLIAIIVALLVFPFFYIGHVMSDFYNFKNIDPENIELKTPSGNYYLHDFNEQVRENGYLVNIYICEEELREEWNKRSTVKYDDELNGYPLGSTLIRYLTSLGYRKDSTGVCMLTEEDIRLIEKGATNYRFKNHFFSLYPRIYETIWEIDNYIRTGDPNDKTLAQRIEFIKASLVLIKNNSVWGIGTGNWVSEYNDVYIEMNTNLSPENWSPSHNQYLNYIVKFGFAGFLWIMFAIILPVFLLGNRRNFILIFFLILMAFANLGDANLETHTGLSFFIFFYSILLWNSTGNMKKPIQED